MTEHSGISGAWALLPVKSRLAAKTRLASALPPGGRQALQRAMLTDMLNSLRAAQTLEGVAIISSDRCFAETARRHGAVFIPEMPETGNLNQAIEIGVRQLQMLGASMIAIIPADVPLIDATEIDHAVREAARLKSLIVVPDRHDEGTNALVFPADSKPVFEFGPGSLERHLSRPGQVPAVAMELRSIALDLDTLDDISCFCATENSAANAPRTHGVLTLANAHRERKVCENV